MNKKVFVFISILFVIIFLGFLFSKTTNKALAQTELCNNNIDDDGDGLIDCDDPDCNGDPACPCPPNICQDLLELLSAHYSDEFCSWNYNPIADVNKDKVVDIFDTVMITRRCGDAAFCQAIWNDTTNPCAAVPGCVPDGPNEICPPNCTSAEDPDCGAPLDCEKDCGCVCPAEYPCSSGTCPPELRGGLVPCGKNCDDPCTQICECAPCTLCHLFVLFKRIVDFVTINIIFPLVVLMFVVAGIMFLTAGGDPGRIGGAKKILTAAVIGLVILLTAWLIVNTIITFLTPAGSPFQSWHTINCPVP